MDNLPTEILREIFLASVVDGWPRAFSNFRSFAIPLRISHVCRRWRDVSLKFGTLWSYLCITQSHDEVPKQYRALKHIFDTCLQRTNGSPLNFVLHCIPGKDPEAHLTAEHMVTRMLSQQHRWKNVNFYWALSELSPDFTEIHATDMPILSSLTLWIVSRTRMGERVCANISIERSPQLEELSLYGNFILDVGPEPIRTLTGPCFFSPSEDFLEDDDGGVYLELLKIAPNLHSLDIQFDYDDGGSGMLCDVHALVLEKLRILRLAIGESTSFIVRSLTVPALKALHYNDDDETNGGEVLLKFMQRSMPPLTHLHIGGHIVNERTFIDTLRLLSSLEELRVERIKVRAWLFEALALRPIIPSGETRPEGVDVICPRLGSLRIEWLDVPQDDTAYLDAFCAMLETRCLVLRTFRMVCLNEGADEVKLPLIPDEDYFKLRSFFDDGWGVWVKGYGVDPSPFSD